MLGKLLSWWTMRSNSSSNWSFSALKQARISAYRSQSAESAYRSQSSRHAPSQLTLQRAFCKSCVKNKHKRLGGYQQEARQVQRKAIQAACQGMSLFMMGCHCQQRLCTHALPSSIPSSNAEGSVLRLSMLEGEKYVYHMFCVSAVRSQHQHQCRHKR